MNTRVLSLCSKTLLLCLSITAFLLIVVFPGVAQNPVDERNDKAVLLKNISELPVPDSPNLISATHILNAEPQIIATVSVGIGSGIQFNVLATSVLQKGRIAIIGSSLYFKKPLLDNVNVQQLLCNIIDRDAKHRKNHVQIWGQSDDLQQFLLKQGYSVMPKANHVINKSTRVLILSEDLKDSLEEVKAEAFIRSGGTLLCASPLPDWYRENPNRDATSPRINILLTKAGLYTAYYFVCPEGNNRKLNTGEIPPYLHFTSMMKALEDHSYLKWTNEEREMMLVSLTASLSLNRSDSSPINKIKKIFNLTSDSALIPSPGHPLIKNNIHEFMAYRMLHILISKQLELSPDLAYTDPASKIFPGAVADSATRVNTKITIPVEVGSQGLWEPAPVYYRWHSTGLYVPAGEKVSVITEKKDTAQHLKAQIGVHNDELLHLDEFTRTPYDLTRTFELTGDTTTVYSPYGGILMIKIPDTCSLKNITVTIKGAVRYPYFKLGTTNVNDWKNTIRKYGAPWAELASDKIILTVPSYRIRNLEDPDKLLQFWDEVLDTDASLAVISSKRVHPERIIVDEEVAYGALFTDTYKIVAPDDDGCKNMLDEAVLRQEGSWGHFHELGHRHQFWGIDFEGIGEVSVNLYTMYVYDKLLHKGLYNHVDIPDKATVISKIKKYMDSNPNFDRWKADPFLALCMYIELIEGFGWHPIEQVYQNYRALPRSQYPVTEADKRDYWFVQICGTTGKNLSKFFGKWSISITEKAKASVSALPEWLPDELKPTKDANGVVQ